MRHTEPTLDKLHGAQRVALQDPGFISRGEVSGALTITYARPGGAEHEMFIEVGIAKWAPIIKAACKRSGWSPSCIRRAS